MKRIEILEFAENAGVCLEAAVRVEENLLVSNANIAVETSDEPIIQWHVLRNPDVAEFVDNYRIYKVLKKLGFYPVSIESIKEAADVFDEMYVNSEKVALCLKFQSENLTIEEMLNNLESLPSELYTDEVLSSFPQLFEFPCCREFLKHSSELELRMNVGFVAETLGQLPISFLDKLDSIRDILQDTNEKVDVLKAISVYGVDAVSKIDLSSGISVKELLAGPGLDSVADSTIAWLLKHYPDFLELLRGCSASSDALINNLRFVMACDFSTFDSVPDGMLKYGKVVDGVRYRKSNFDAILSGKASGLLAGALPEGFTLPECIDECNVTNFNCLALHLIDSCEWDSLDVSKEEWVELMSQHCFWNNESVKHRDLVSRNNLVKPLSECAEVLLKKEFRISSTKGYDVRKCGDALINIIESEYYQAVRGVFSYLYSDSVFAQLSNKFLSFLCGKSESLPIDVYLGQSVNGVKTIGFADCAKIAYGLSSFYKERVYGSIAFFTLDLLEPVNVIVDGFLCKILNRMENGCVYPVIYKELKLSKMGIKVSKDCCISSESLDIPIIEDTGGFCIWGCSQNAKQFRYSDSDYVAYEHITIE